MRGEGLESTRWNHANPVLEVCDVAGAIAYYREVLGLTPSWMWEDRIGGVHTDHSPIEIYLSRASDPRRRGSPCLSMTRTPRTSGIEWRVPRSSTNSKRSPGVCAGSLFVIPTGI